MNFTTDKPKKTGIATLKQLNKECLKIDLTQVRLEGGRQSKWMFHTDKNGENPYIKVGVGRKWNPVRTHEFFWIDLYRGIEKETWKEHKDNRNTEGATFTGGKRSSFHTEFTNAKIMFDKSTDEILGVLYALDNDYLNEWLRQTIDPSIPNNYDELHAEKEFEILVTTTTYTTEKVKVVGRSYDECVEKMKPVSYTHLTLPTIYSV